MMEFTTFPTQSEPLTVIFFFIWNGRTLSFSVKVHCENHKINHRLTSFWPHLFVVSGKKKLPSHNDWSWENDRQFLAARAFFQNDKDLLVCKALYFETVKHKAVFQIRRCDTRSIFFYLALGSSIKWRTLYYIIKN